MMKIKFMKNINNDTLYSKTLKWYLFTLIKCYFECFNNMEDGAEYLNSIKIKISETYKSYSKTKEKQLHWIILFSIFRFSPKLYKIILSSIKS